MFNALFQACKSIFTFNKTSTQVAAIIEMLEKDYQKDGNAKDAAIDAIIEILQAHKTNANQVQK